jgi:hypothetical protein
MIQIPSFGALGFLNFTRGVRLLVHGAIFSDDIVFAHFVIVSPRPATWEYEHAIPEMHKHACMWSTWEYFLGYRQSHPQWGLHNASGNFSQ